MRSLIRFDYANWSLININILPLVYVKIDLTRFTIPPNNHSRSTIFFPKPQRIVFSKLSKDKMREFDIKEVVALEMEDFVAEHVLKFAAQGSVSIVSEDPKCIFY